MKRLGAFALIALALAGLAVGQPTVEDRLASIEPELDREIQKRGRHIDPGELLDLMRNNRVRVRVLDVRDEARFNLFHLVDARRRARLPDESSCVRPLNDGDVKVVVGPDEAAQETAWKRLRALGVLNAYMLEGGIDAWLKAYAPDGFDAALGARHEASFPRDAERREYKKKVKVRRAAAGAGGGCG